MKVSLSVMMMSVVDPRATSMDGDVVNEENES